MFNSTYTEIVNKSLDEWLGVTHVPIDRGINQIKFDRYGEALNNIMKSENKETEFAAADKEILVNLETAYTEVG